MAITFKTVIFELQFLAELAQDNPNDPRLPQLFQDAKADLAKCGQKVGADDPIINP